MKARFAVIVAMVVAACLTGSQPASAQFVNCSLYPDQCGTISGVVTSAYDGTPVAGIDVCASDGSGGPCGTSIADGSYRIIVGPGTWDVFSGDSRLGFCCADQPGVVVVVGQTTANINLQLPLVPRTGAPPVPGDTPPVLDSIGAAPKSVAAGTSVLLTAHVVGQSSPVTSVIIFYQSPSGFSAAAVAVFSLNSGTSMDGLWQASLKVPAKVDTSIWTVSALQAVDSAGGVTVVFSPDAPTPNGTFDVVGDPPPMLTASLIDTPSVYGWFNHPVTVRFQCSDSDPSELAGSCPTGFFWGIAPPGGGGRGGGSFFDCNRQLNGFISFGCPSDIIGSEEGAYQEVGGGVTDSEGNDSASAVVTGINIDLTPPTVTVSTDAHSYTVDQAITIVCTASDALSGVASTTCPSSPMTAYSLNVGTDTLSATATDKAGNVGYGSTTVLIQVTFDSLCNLTTSFLLNTRSAGSYCVLLNLAAKSSAGGSNAQDRFLQTYIHRVEHSPDLSSDDAAILVGLARDLF